MSDIRLKHSIKSFRKLIAKYKHATFFPTVRQTYPQMLLAQQIVSVQPMTIPSGLIFYLDYTYGTKVSGSQENRDKETSEKKL